MDESGHLPLASDDAIFGPAEAAPRKPRRDDRFVARVTHLGRKGRPAGGIGPYAVEWSGWAGVPRWGAVPGALVEGQIKRRRRDQLEARMLQVVEPSPDAVEPRCPHFGSCGGCAFQDLAYPAQLEVLRRSLADTLAPLEFDSTPQLAPAPSPFAYRNKMDFTFSNRRWVEGREGPGDGRPTDFALGLHVAGRFEKVLDVEHCAIHFDGADALLSDVRAAALASGLPAWDVREHTGFWRHAVLRRGEHTGETMVHLVTTPVGADDVRERALQQLTATLLERHPQLTCVQHSETERLSTVAVGERQRTLHGTGRIHDELLGVRFAISAESFFQTNTRAAEGMLTWIGERLSDERGGVLHDLYCGAGAIGLTLAARFERVVGVELVESAVTDARANAALNGFEHVDFHLGDVPAVLRGATPLPAPEVVVVDPPRAGLHPDLVETLCSSPPRRLIYVSCNPKSAARDLAPMVAGPYAIEASRAFDLFPHTPHVECVFDLRRRA
ncbi:MAG: 23S rRNA (uracil(1939)-C(5))-methyltransferase RlmD [Planctomycetota bacterium]